MAFNFVNLGKSVAVIKGGKLDKKIISLDTNEDDEDEFVKTFTKIELPTTSKFMQVPNNTVNRECCYIVGPSGSGKTTYTTNFIKEIQKKHKDFPVILFSTLQDDFEDVKNLKRIRLDETLISDPMSCTAELADSIVVFDDIDCVKNKKVREAIMSTLKECLEIGRHVNTYVIMTNHLATNGPDTKPILNEASSITFFPQAGTGRGLTYLLESYCGLNKKDIEFIKTKKSRWCTFYKTYPMVLLFEREILTLDELTKQAKEFAKK